VTRSWCDAGKAGAELILLLMNSRPAAADELNLCYALRHLGKVRDILVLRIKGYDFNRPQLTNPGGFFSQTGLD
jgi:hypothetical protein